MAAGSTRIDRATLHGGSLREHAARGTMINAGFQIGLALLGASRRFLIAIFLTAADYGLWGLIYTAVISILFLKDVGIGDKYIQQDDADQERAFQTAFSLELVWSSIFAVLILIGVPVFSLIYGRPDIIAPGCVMALVVLAAGFQTPTWIFYRQMRYVRQRALQAIEPVLGFCVTMALGAAGFGYWSIVIGLVVGTWTAAVACVLSSPFRLRWRFERSALRDYFSFSWPLLLSAGGGVVALQAAVIVGNETVGLAGIGAIGLASTIAAFADRADAVVTQTLYPAVCAVKDRMDLLYESFVKSNRLALIWGLPFGFGLALFAPDIVHWLLGDKWKLATGLLSVFGVTAALQQIAFNWTAYQRAVGDTRPIAVNAVATAAAFVAVVIPGMLLWDLTGYALAACAALTVSLVTRAYYLSRLFDGFRFLRHSLRAIIPSVPAVAVVLAARVLESGDRSGGLVLAEVALYVAVTAAATWVFERALLREMAGYLLRAGGARPSPSPS